MSDARLLGIFREESLERLDRMAEVLLDAETHGGDAEAVASLFRDAHSIKGSAGMLGFDLIGTVAGAMEDLLADAREAGALRVELVAPLLGGADAIRAAIDGDPAGLEPALAALGPSSDDGPRFTSATSETVPTAEDDATTVGADAASAPDAPGGGPALATASHTAATLSVRVPAEKVDRLLAAVGETALHRRQLEHLAGAGTSEALRTELQQGETLVTELQDAVLGLRTLPLQTIVGGLPRAVRDIAADTGREVRLELEGTQTPLDRSILDGISEVLVHILRNATSHGIEPPDERERAGKPRVGTIRLAAEQRGGLVALACADDGRGVSAELLERARERGSLTAVLADPGFSTAGEVSELSGRGVGLDAVNRHVESLGGSLEVTSRPGSGTTVTLLLPLTLAVIRVLLVERDGQPFGLPLSGVERAVRDAPIHSLHGRRTLELDGATLPLVDLADVLRADATALVDDGPVLIVTSGGRRVAIACDRLLGDREAVVKSLGSLLAPVTGYLGATILDDGGIALLLDPAHLVRTADVTTHVERVRATDGQVAPKVLVVDDQFTVRELERTILEAAGYRVTTAEDGRAALATLAREHDVDCVVSDVDMPGMDGLELLEAIRAQPGHAALPVVIVTSRDDEAARTRGADAGADAWVVKSHFDQQALLDTVGQLVALR